MKKRDRRQTPTNTSLVVGSCAQLKLITAGWSDAVPESTEVKPDTASAFYLDGEGTSVKSKDSKNTARIISNNDLKRKEERKRIKNSYRVPVLNPDGTPAMPTTNRTFRLDSPA